MALNDATSSAPLRVLAVVEWYPPAYKAGGPIRSVYNLIQLLNAQTSHPLEVVCGPRDLGDEEPLAGIVCDTPHDQDGVRVTYASSLSLAWWRAKLRGTADAPAPDVVYLNSLFSVPFALQPLRAARELGIRVVLAPRGMLGAGALAIKPAKKTLFLTAARLLGWFRHVRWHASTPVERSEIRRHFPQAQVHVAMNVPLAPRECEAPPWESNLTWLMLGRIQQKKNLHFALEALQDVDLKGKNVRIELVGPAEDEAYLQQLLDMARPGVDVVHRGALPPDQLGAVWAKAHALLMPTTHENFGHAVVEAWAHGRPVLLSDQTPWRGLKEAGLGWDLPLDKEVWKRGLSEALAWDQASWENLSRACVDKHRGLVEDATLVEDNRALFEAPWPSA